VDNMTSGVLSQPGSWAASQQYSTTSRVEQYTKASAGNIMPSSSSSSSQPGSNSPSQRPPGGGAVPLLLTGGSDGSVRAWDLRTAHLGQSWMTVHPHTGESWMPAVPGSTQRVSAS
jgi:WD40 repeat protein